MQTIATRLLLVLLTSLLFSVNTCRADVNKDIELLMQLSALDNIIEVSHQNIVNELTIEKITAPNAALNDDEIAVYLEKLSVPILKQHIIDVLMRDLEKSDVDYLVDFFKQNDIKAYTALLAASYGSDFSAKKAEYVRGLATKPLSKERIELITRVSDASMVVAQRVFLQAAIIKAITKGKLEYFNKYNDDEKQKLDYYVVNYKDTLRANFRKDMLVTHVFLFDSMNDAQLTHLLALFSDEKRMRYEMMVTDAFANALAFGFDHGIKTILKYREKPPT